MNAPGCSSSCCRTNVQESPIDRELKCRWWIGRGFIVSACSLAYPAYTVSGWFWIPAALAAWFGTWQTIFSKGCGSCGASSTDRAVPKLNPRQRATRLSVAHRFLAATAILAAISAALLPALWPLTAVAGWFAASFYVAVWTRYVGCPEIGAIPSWLLGHHIETRCAPLERRDACADDQPRA
jgi:hypothetical protein